MGEDIQVAEEQVKEPDVIEYKCKCGYAWEMEVSLEMISARHQHQMFLKNPDRVPCEQDKRKGAPIIKKRDEFICKKCGEMRELTITQV